MIRDVAITGWNDQDKRVIEGKIIFDPDALSISVNLHFQYPMGKVTGLAYDINPKSSGPSERIVYVHADEFLRNVANELSDGASLPMFQLLRLHDSKRECPPR